MKNGLYKVVGFDSKGKQICEWNDLNIGDEVYVSKINQTCDCNICGKARNKGYSISSEYEFQIGTECIKHIKLELVK